jgi:uncharacterized protein (UPF0147 family)
VAKNSNASDDTLINLLSDPDDTVAAYADKTLKANSVNSSLRILNQPVGVRNSTALHSTDSHILEMLSNDTNMEVLQTLLVNKYLPSEAISTILDTIVNKSLKAHDEYAAMRCGDAINSILLHDNITNDIRSKIINYAKTYPKFKAVIEDHLWVNNRTLNTLWDDINR